MIHIYQGFCPDELQPDSRDSKCPACQVEVERDKLRAKVTAAEKIFAHFGGLSELAKWENSQGESAKELIDEYMKL